MKKITRRIFWVAGIVGGTLLIAGFICFLYFGSLLNLINRSEITGNPSIAESDLVDPDDIVTPTISMPATPFPTTSQTATETTQPTTVMTLSDLPIPTSSSVYNILLIGTDNRGNESNGRSDAMIILSINKKTHKIHLVSLMRGLYVYIEGHDYSMLNNAFSWGGPRRLLTTIEQNLRVKINDYIVMDFDTFSQAIDLVGGVDIDLTVKEVENLTPIFPAAGLVEGSNHLSGELALAYARIRHIDSDYQRTGRQRAIINSLIHKITQMNLTDLDALARQLIPLLRTNLKSGTMISLLVGSLDYINYPVRQLMLPIRNSFETIVVRGIQMVQFDVNANIEELQRFLYED
jgi:polyisoprenyl-teichoic acid--peptidoglycan teichoic acid transferase